MLISLSLGMVVGCIMGLTGAGGGILAVPLLVFGLHFTVAQASPIGLLAVGIAAAIGAAMGLRKGIVRYRAAGLIAAVGIVIAPAGFWLARQLDTRYLTILFALVLLGVAYKSVREGMRHPGEEPERPEFPCVRFTESGKFIWTKKCAARLSAIGGLAGLLSGLLGVGGGFVIVPALQRITDLTMQSIVATSLAVIALISLVSVAGSIYGGHFDYAAGFPFAAGAVLGTLVAGRYASRWPGHHLKFVFGIVCSLVALGLFVKSAG